MSEDKKLVVRDKSLIYQDQVRIHEVSVNGHLIPIRFTYGQPTVVPYEVGMKFVGKGFMVQDAEGRDIHAPVVAPAEAEIVLGADEVIAKYYELTDEALSVRCVLTRGGEKFFDGGDRQKMIDFLSGLPEAEPEAEDELEGEGEQFGPHLPVEPVEDQLEAFEDVDPAELEAEEAADGAETDVEDEAEDKE